MSFKEVLKVSQEVLGVPLITVSTYVRLACYTRGGALQFLPAVKL